MNRVFVWTHFILIVLFVPPLCLGTIRKTKALLQSRVGAPVWQPILDMNKLFRKSEVVSDTMSGAFRFTAAAAASILLTVIWLIPWITFKPWSPQADIFVVVYLLALAKFIMLLGSLDSGSIFAAFATSREATLNLLVEPAFCLALLALALLTRSTDLHVIFSTHTGDLSPMVWFCSGISIVLVSLVELSRMPIDDPATHLELTMIHEAMFLEASGKNLMLIEFTQGFKILIFWGLSVQCFLHTIPNFSQINALQQNLLNLVGLFTIAILIGIFESVSVKLQWRKIPEFIAYILTISLTAALFATATQLSNT